MKPRWDYLIQVENYNIPFDLKSFFEGEGLNFGHSYYQEDVLNSGYDDIVFWGLTGENQIREAVNRLIAMGVPADQIAVFRFHPVKI